MLWHYHSDVIIYNGGDKYRYVGKIGLWFQCAPVHFLDSTRVFLVASYEKIVIDSQLVVIIIIIIIIISSSRLIVALSSRLSTAASDSISTCPIAASFLGRCSYCSCGGRWSFDKDKLKVLRQTNHEFRKVRHIIVLQENVFICVGIERVNLSLSTE